MMLRGANIDILTLLIQKRKGFTYIYCFEDFDQRYSIVNMTPLKLLRSSLKEEVFSLLDQLNGLILFREDFYIT